MPCVRSTLSCADFFSFFEVHWSTLLCECTSNNGTLCLLPDEDVWAEWGWKFNSECHDTVCPFIAEGLSAGSAIVQVLLFLELGQCDGWIMGRIKQLRDSHKQIEKIPMTDAREFAQWCLHGSRFFLWLEECIPYHAVWVYPRRKKKKATNVSFQHAVRNWQSFCYLLYWSVLILPLCAE